MEYKTDGREYRELTADSLTVTEGNHELILYIYWKNKYRHVKEIAILIILYYLLKIITLAKVFIIIQVFL
jgi:hypothetical protein